jgi:hypothetical protein
MRFRIAHFVTAAAIGLAIAFASARPADAQSVMKVCGAQWKAAKAAGATSGETWPQFLAQCRTQQSGASAAPSAPAATAYAPAPGAPVTGKTASECSHEYSANKAAIKASGQSKRAYIAACRAGTATTPASAPTYAPQAAPAHAGYPAPAQPAYPAPAQPAYPAPAPAPQVRSSTPIACPGDTPVWVNTKSHIYHFPGTRNYGTTKQGTYMCERAAQAAGDRAAENEHHP